MTLKGLYWHGFDQKIHMYVLVTKIKQKKKIKIVFSVATHNKSHLDLLDIRRLPHRASMFYSSPAHWSDRGFLVLGRQFVRSKHIQMCFLVYFVTIRQLHCALAL